VSVTHELNLDATLPPIGLLECRRALRGAAPGEVLKVTLKDPQMVEDLVRIIRLSPDRIDSVVHRQSTYHVYIRKSPSTPVKEET